jgi:uncharacterized protein (TIGR02145 family)
MSKRLLGIGDVYTYDYKQVHKTRNVGFGYYDPNKVSTTSSTDGYVLVDGVLSVVNEDGSSEPGPGPISDETTIGNQVWKNVDLSYNDGGNGIITAQYHQEIEPGKYPSATYYSRNAVRRISADFPGWHIPTDEDYEDLKTYFNDNSESLRTTSGWYYALNGTDTTNFHAYPFGICQPYNTTSRSFSQIGENYQMLINSAGTLIPAKLSGDNSMSYGEVTATYSWYYTIRLIKD